jgi:hypothetical protein
MQGFVNSGTAADGVQRQYDDATPLGLHSDNAAN